MAKKNDSQKPSLASVAADPQAVNPRVTSVAQTVDPPMAAPLIWFLDISCLQSPHSIGTPCRAVALETGSSSSPPEENREIDLLFFQFVGMLDARPKKLLLELFSSPGLPPSPAPTGLRPAGRPGIAAEALFVIWKSWFGPVHPSQNILGGPWNPA